jgi:hypothetical protein
MPGLGVAARPEILKIDPVAAGGSEEPLSSIPIAPSGRLSQTLGGTQPQGSVHMLDQDRLRGGALLG